MATPQDAINYAKFFIGSPPVDNTTVLYRIADDAHKKFWMAGNWPWTVGTLETVTLANNTQDYNLASAPSDFAFMLNSRTITTDTDQSENELIVTSVLPASTNLKGLAKRVAYVVGTPSKLRFLPTPAGYTSFPVVLSYYKKAPVTIGAGNIGSVYDTTFNVPAQWFYVYQEMVLLKAFTFFRDARAGSATFVNGGVQYTGQYAVVEAALQEVRNAEKKIYDISGAEVRSSNG